jgi:hypothetical protein
MIMVSNTVGMVLHIVGLFLFGMLDFVPVVVVHFENFDASEIYVILFSFEFPDVLAE